jgi:hypothetical protein
MASVPWAGIANDAVEITVEPATIRSSVVFPHPVGPTSAAQFPSRDRPVLKISLVI